MHSSVEDLFRSAATNEEEKEFAEEVAEGLQQRKLVHYLFGARNARNLSQKDIATAMGCSQSRVSKLESGVDEDLRIGDLRDYLGAMNLDMKLLLLEKDQTVFNEIKFHAFRIRHCLDQMVELAGSDMEIGKGVSKAHVETLLNLVRLVVESAQNLPAFKCDAPQIMEAEDDASASS